MATEHLQRLESRVIDCESALSHHQREYELLNHVVIEQADAIAQLKRQLSVLESSLTQLQHEFPDDRDLSAEKPPHY